MDSLRAVRNPKAVEQVEKRDGSTPELTFTHRTLEDGVLSTLESYGFQTPEVVYPFDSAQGIPFLYIPPN